MSGSDTRDVVTALQAQPAFAECSEDDLADLARHADRSSIPANWPLIHQETPSDACYEILSGTAAVSVGGEPVATLDTGAVVGEAGVAGHKLRNATVTSTSELDLLNITAADFAALVDRRPALAGVLLARTAPAADAAAEA